MNKPVAWMFEKDGAYMCFKNIDGVDFEKGIPLYTHPVEELTDEEIWKIYNITGLGNGMALRFARAILRKAQEK